MNKYILSALAALAILSGVSSVTVAAPHTNGDSYTTDQSDDSFPKNFWEDLGEKAGG